MIGFLVALALAQAGTDSVATVPDLAATAGPTVAPLGGTDSGLAGTSDSLREYRLPATVVKGVRRRVGNAAVDSRQLRSPGWNGLPGAVDVLRDQPGVAFQGDLSGQFSSMGIPSEATAVTWDGGRILWPWHFGGLYGAVDDWAAERVDWMSPGDASSPDQGGGWLRIQSRAWSDSDAFHGGIRLGTTAGGLAAWGRRGDWGWQLEARRTWLDAALWLAHDQGWMEQSMQVAFQDVTAALAWKHGAWSLGIGVFEAQDTLGIELGDRDSISISWSNLMFPLSVAWHDRGWNFDGGGAFSRYTRRDPDLLSLDTTDLYSLEFGLEREWTGSGSVGLRFRAEDWLSSHRSFLNDRPVEWAGDESRKIGSARVSGSMRKDDVELRAWGGAAVSSRDDALAEGGGSVHWNPDSWSVWTALDHRMLSSVVIDQGERGSGAVSPAWILPSGSSPRSTRWLVGMEHRGRTDQAAFQFGTMGWLRSIDGWWSWTPVSDRGGEFFDRWEARRSDGWGAGIEVRGDLRRGRLDLQGRQILSADVLADLDTSGNRLDARWAPWDQRWRTEASATWWWKGRDARKAGGFFLKSNLSGKTSTGVAHSLEIGQTTIVPSMDIDTMRLVSYHPLRGFYRTAYLRFDLTPLSVGRNGRWAVWWTVVNITNHSNLLGWFNRGAGEKGEPIEQIPFLPVVFGAQIEF